MGNEENTINQNTEEITDNLSVEQTTESEINQDATVADVKEDVTEEITQPKKKGTRKERRVAKLKKKLINPVDIRYRGPLSYRYLRMIAWLAIAAGQILSINSASQSILEINMLSLPVSTILSVISNLSFPLFLIAAFGLILKTSENYKKILISYGISFLAIGLGIVILYLRYISSVLLKLGVDPVEISNVGTLLGSKVEINVFSDLFAFAVFHFFMNYTPTKHFQGKKIAIFRLFAVLPFAFILMSYVLKVMFDLQDINLPFYVFPFLTTKSPLVFVLFSVISLIIKYRERMFRKIGLTKNQYQEFLKTNRNSLYFSISLSIVILIFALIEFVIIGALAYQYVSVQGMEIEAFVGFIGIFGLGECLSMILAIPIVFLYSYTKEHKGSLLDKFLPIIGIVFILFIYLEGFYRFIMIAA